MQLQNYKQITSDDVIDSMCFFCDFMQHTKAHDDAAMACDLANKFIEIVESEEFGDDDDVRQTGVYGLGIFGYFAPKGAFAAQLPKSVEIMKGVIGAADAFDEENMVQTENALGALARLSYSQMDGTVLTEADFEGVLSKMPFTSDQEECQMSHKIFLQ
jgi:hypothetical protein